MTAVRTTPADRLDRLEFGTRREALDHIVEFGAYRCPHCGSAVEFSSRHFGRQAAPQTNLTPSWAERFDELRPLNPQQWESFLDFHCPGCRAPVRIVYAVGQSWAMGAHSWRIVDLLEASSWPKTSYMRGP